MPLSLQQHTHTTISSKMEHRITWTCSNRDTLNVGGEEGHFLVALEPILLRGDNVRREDVEDLEMLWRNVMRKLDYPSFNPTSGNQFYNIVVLKGEAGFRYLERFKIRADKNGTKNGYVGGDLFVDTESIMTPSRLALISICCPRDKSVLLWRVHEMSREGLTAVWHSIEDLVAWRGGKLVVFGPEHFFTKDSTHNIQPNVHPMPALIDVAKNYGVILDKSNTLSDWGVFKLRRDQEEYAAMDALVLYAIDGGRILEQSERPLRKFLLTVTH
ncbi:hypothetical protein B9Z55_011004 [Caenorhabditis nigoni]|uniref:3'-5' exonuclease domain-containing protein n=1 Tax=Caenorhabditis nigoni TaxID=1611254 RepID=A0A2G5UIU3_9PELO|nr:hypothetical protein B9Z55_011004 [Caenorhabditis nigoni]